MFYMIIHAVTIVNFFLYTSKYRSLYAPLGKKIGVYDWGPISTTSKIGNLIYYIFERKAISNDLWQIFFENALFVDQRGHFLKPSLSPKQCAFKNSYQQRFFQKFFSRIFESFIEFIYVYFRIKKALKRNIKLEVKTTLKITPILYKLLYYLGYI